VTPLRACLDPQRPTQAQEARDHENDSDTNADCHGAPVAEKESDARTPLLPRWNGFMGNS